MKKTLLLCCLCLLCGCGNKIGSFEKGTLEMKKLAQKINHETSEKTWDMSLLKEDGESSTSLQEYGLTSEDVICYAIFPSIVAVDPTRVAIFEVSDQHKAMVKEKVKAQIMNMQNDTNYLPQYTKQITTYKEAEIGNYYIIVIGNDAARVLEFIEECA